MANKLDFPVAITRKTVGVSERGFGTILILDTENDKKFELIDEQTATKMTGKAGKIAKRLFMQKPKPHEVAIYGKKGTASAAIAAAIEEHQGDFFWVVCTDNSVEAIKAIAETAQVNSKLYGVTINDLAAAKQLADLESENTFIAYHNNPDAYLAEGLAVVMSYNIGGKTAKFKKVEGVEAANVTMTQEQELEKNNIFTYKRKLGVLQTTEGKCKSGEYIDIVLGEYWIRFRMEEALQRLAVTEDKIPYTAKGIAMLVGECEKILSRAVAQGIVEANQYVVDYLDRSQVPANDVALRKYDYIRWTAMLQGAIHTGQISGILTYDMISSEVNR